MLLHPQIIDNPVKPENHKQKDSEISVIEEEKVYHQGIYLS